MSRIYAIHEYELKRGVMSNEFESAIVNKLANLHMTGLVSKHLLRGYKGERKGKYAVLWIFESQEALEKLFGTETRPLPEPPDFVGYENFIAKYIDREPMQITFTDYCEVG